MSLNQKFSHMAYRLINTYIGNFINDKPNGFCYMISQRNLFTEGDFKDEKFVSGYTYHFMLNSECAKTDQSSKYLVKFTNGEHNLLREELYGIKNDQRKYYMRLYFASQNKIKEYDENRVKYNEVTY